MVLLGVMLAGAIGAPVRFLVADLVSERGDAVLPTGTLAVNVTGSLLLGFLTGLALYHAFPATPKAVLGTGFCGAYTTFSTFTVETVDLLAEGDWPTAVRSIAANLVGSLLAAAAGLALAAAL